MRKIRVHTEVHHPGSGSDCRDLPEGYPDGPRRREAMRARHDKAHLTAVYRVGKSKAGHELDGQTWLQYPGGAT